MEILLFIILLLMSLVFYKYHIDTQLTIKEISKDRNQFRSQMWKFINNRSKEVDHQKIFTNPYNDLKVKINRLADDIENTDFNSFDNIKDEVLSALREIDSYGDKK